METWGNWTFNNENEDLLAEVLNKFASNQCSLDTPKKVLLSSLATLSKVCTSNYLYHNSQITVMDY